MRETCVGLASLVLLALFMAALVLNLAPQSPPGSVPLDVVVSELDGRVGP